MGEQGYGEEDAGGTGVGHTFAGPGEGIESLTQEGGDAATEEQQERFHELLNSEFRILA